MKVLFLLGFLTIFVAGISGSKDLPETFKRCKLDDNISSCLKDAINDALPKLITDYKELGLQQLEPFHIPKFTFQSSGGPVNMKQEFTNLVMPDFISNTVVTDLKFDLKNHEAMLDIYKEEMHMEGNYEITGRVLVLPVQGKGKFKVKYTGLSLRFNMKFEEVMKDGETYLHYTSVETFMKPKKMEMHFENLFNGDKALGDSTNQFLNENWKDIFTELEPDYSKFFSGICLKLVNKFYGQFPVNKVYIP